MNRYEEWLDTWAIGRARIVRWGHWGRPLLWFASDGGNADDFAGNGLLDAISGLVEAGRVRVYCIDSYDAASWRRGDVPLEERARLHQKFEDFVVNDVVPAIDKDLAGHQDVLVGGCSMGAFHAANLTLRRADLFPLALCFSGVYDLSRIGWGERGLTFYFHNPQDYVANVHGEHLAWLRERASLLLCVGRGAWEDDSASGALPATLRFADLLRAKGIRHELDVWGEDAPHDWPSWRRQLAYHLPRFV